MRRALFWAHLVAGVVAGAIILILSLTGTLLSFERQVTAWADRRANRTVASSPGAARMPVEALVAKASAATSVPPSSILLRSGADCPVEIGFGRERTLFVDPSSGETLGEGSPAIRRLYSTIEAWHRRLGAKPAGRSLGRELTGASNLVFLFVVATGPILWWPRTWTRQALRSSMLFQFRLRGRARDWNWHNTFGIWCSIPLFFVVLTGVVMSYPWANQLLYRLAGSEAPPPESAPQGRSPRPVRLDGLDSLFARAGELAPGWKTISARLAPGKTVSFTIDEGDGGQPHRRMQLDLDRESGAVVRSVPFDAAPTGRKLRILARFVHTGEAGGIPGQFLAAVASAGAVVLVWTGLALAWRRFRSWRSRHGFRDRLPIP